MRRLIDPPDGSSGPCGATPIRIGDRHWRSIAISIDFNVGIQADGSLWAWGNNDMGQLGLGSRVNAAQPAQVGCDRTRAPERSANASETTGNALAR